MNCARDIPALAMTASKRGASSGSRRLGESTFECAGVVATTVRWTLLIVQDYVRLLHITPKLLIP